MARFATGLWFLLLPAGLLAYEPPVSTRSLRNIADIRKLTYEESRLAPPVNLRVTVISHLSDGFDAQDNSGGLFFECPPDRIPRIGDELEIAGNVTGGFHGSYVIIDDMKKVGWKSPPKALNFRPDFVQTGLGDNRWVEIEGLMVDVRFDDSEREGRGLLVTGQSDLVIRFRNAHEDFDIASLEKLVGSWVRLQGSGAPLFNDQRQRIGSDIVCAKQQFVSVIERPTGSEPVRLDEIGRWDSRRTRQGLVETSGTVTYIEGPSSLVVQAGAHGARVRTLAPVAISVGEPVILTGLPETEGYFVGLRYATVEPSETGEPPLEAVADESPLSREHAFRLVTFSGRLIEKGRTLINLQVNEALVPVSMPVGLAATLPREGSELQIRGVKRVEADERGDVRSVTVAVRDAADIAVIAVPSWWTPAKLRTAILILAAGAGLFLAWLLALNRRVKQQTALISEQIESNATLEERNRIARELHDTLSQGFSGVGYQLASVSNHLTSDPSKARAKLDAAREMVEHSLAEARESLIGLRIPTGAESLDFPEATLAAAKSRCEEADVAFESERKGWNGSPKLPPETAFACHRILLEAVANALRHGRARHLRISLAADSDRAHLVVADDGVGFAVSEKPPEGHYGIQGMRERAQRLGADLDIRSAPGEGTSVELSLPLS
ncbi:MAG: sensor histidine kinase [Verrucomicrobiae bacterium]|nr:sensor histidine kinase [Verrucomicrobiae bacterium]